MIKPEEYNQTYHATSWECHRTLLVRTTLQQLLLTKLTGHILDLTSLAIRQNTSQPPPNLGAIVEDYVSPSNHHQQTGLHIGCIPRTMLPGKNDSNRTGHPPVHILQCMQVDSSGRFDNEKQVAKLKVHRRKTSATPRE